MYIISFFHASWESNYSIQSEHAVWVAESLYHLDDDIVKNLLISKVLLERRGFLLFTLYNCTVYMTISVSFVTFFIYMYLFYWDLNSKLHVGLFFTQKPSLPFYCTYHAKQYYKALIATFTYPCTLQYVLFVMFLIS